MLKQWDNAVVTDINLAMFVAPGTGAPIHNNRAFHGFVLNDNPCEKRIWFSDGTVVKTGALELHYLPKASNYRVENIITGGCWAINFDMLEDLGQAPFNIAFRDPEPIVKIFKQAVASWQEKREFQKTAVRRCIYDIILKIRAEQQRNYIPGEKELLIQPAVDAINRDFTKNDLSVKAMAELCGISEAYFRRIFADKFTVSPKQYIIHLRTEYAKELLQSGQFSVQEIALMCGYTEACHFSREFHKNCGQSPGEYAKASRN